MLDYNILAIDYGEKRLGLACANALLKIPHPLAIITVASRNEKIKQIKPFILKWQPKLLVLGIPHESDNLQKIQLINTIKNFSHTLTKEFNLSVELVNEDFSSLHASSLLKEQGIYGRDQKKHLDALAACSILEAYFIL